MARRHRVTKLMLKERISGKFPAPSGFAPKLEALSDRRRRIIRPVFENPREFVLLSVRALAKQLNTDPATMVRIVRGLGFESIRAFREYLHELSVARITSVDVLQRTAGKGVHSHRAFVECLNPSPQSRVSPTSSS